MAHFGCPNCKSEMIDSLWEGIVARSVYDWTEDGEPKSGREMEAVAAYTENTPRFRCDSCSLEFDEAVALSEPTDSIGAPLKRPG